MAIGPGLVENFRGQAVSNAVQIRGAGAESEARANGYAALADQARSLSQSLTPAMIAEHERLAERAVARGEFPDRLMLDEVDAAFVNRRNAAYVARQHTGIRETVLRLRNLHPRDVDAFTADFEEEREAYLQEVPLEVQEDLRRMFEQEGLYVLDNIATAQRNQEEIAENSDLRANVDELFNRTTQFAATNGIDNTRTQALITELRDAYDAWAANPRSGIGAEAREAGFNAMHAELVGAHLEAQVSDIYAQSGPGNAFRWIEDNIEENEQLQYLPPDTRRAIAGRARAEVRARETERRAERALAAQEIAMMREQYGLLDDVITGEIDAGVAPSPVRLAEARALAERIDARSAQAGLPQTAIASLNALENEARFIEGIRQYSPDELAQIEFQLVNAPSSADADHPLPRAERIEQVRRRRERLTVAYEDAPYRTYASQNDQIDYAPPPLDALFGGDQAEAQQAFTNFFAERRAQRREMDLSGVGVEVDSLLEPREIRSLQALIEENPASLASVASLIAQAEPEIAAEVIDGLANMQDGGARAVGAVAAVAQLSEDGQIVSLVAEGVTAPQRLGDSFRTPLLNRGDDSNNTPRAYQNIVGDAFYMNDTPLASSLRVASEAAYTAIAVRNGWSADQFPESRQLDEFRRITQRTHGATFVGERRYGGVSRSGGHHVILPPRLRSDSFGAFRGRITDNIFAAFSNANEELPRSASGRRITASAASQMRWVTAGSPGRYAIIDRNGEFARAPNGTAFIFDANLALEYMVEIGRFDSDRALGLRSQAELSESRRGRITEPVGFSAPEIPGGFE